MNINVCGFRDAPKDKLVINTTSRSTTWSRGLSPFFCGPVALYSGCVSLNVENAWQYSKVYPVHTDDQQNPTPEYFDWANTGWKKDFADRYPMGKGAKPLYSWWDGNKYGYIEARKKIYAPLYAKAVEQTAAFAKLKELCEQEPEVWLWDFDGYDYKKKGMTFTDVLLNEKRKMGHAFVLAMMIEKQRIWEEVESL